MPDTGKPSKKQIPLRLSDSLFRELSRWAEDDFRSLNGQIDVIIIAAELHLLMLVS